MTFGVVVISAVTNYFSHDLKHVATIYFFTVIDDVLPVKINFCDVILMSLYFTITMTYNCDTTVQVCSGISLLSPQLYVVVTYFSCR